MNFIIIGDKFQKRMKSKGCCGLITVNNKTIVQQQHAAIKSKFPNSNIIYVYGFEGKKFVSYINNSESLKRDILLVHNTSYELKNNVYSLFLASSYMDGPCCILFGNNPIPKKAFDKFRSSQNSQIFLNHKEKNKLGCIINKDKVEHISYDLDNYLADIYYISNTHSSLVRRLITSPSMHNCFVFELFNKLIDMNHKVSPIFI